MTDPEGVEGGEFPIDEIEKLYKAVVERVDEHGIPSREFCSLIDQLTTLQISRSSVGGSVAAMMSLMPGMSTDLSQFLHQYGHLCFEIGRQFVLDYPSDFSDLTTDDFKKR